MPRKTNKVDEARFRNALDTLFANVRFAGVDRPVCSLAVCATLPGEGKTTASVGVARRMAASGKRTLLVECDLRHRSLARALGVTQRGAGGGLCSALLGTAELQDVVVPTSDAGLWLLDAEPGIPTATEVLGSKRFGSFVGALEQAWDYVVFDTPPLDVVIDGALVASVTDAALLVVRAGKTPRRKLAKAYDQLLKAGASVIGTVMNCCDDPEDDYGRYERYYRLDGRGEEEAAPVAPRMAGGAHSAAK